MKKFLIKNGIVIDGSGKERYNANIEISENVISKIGDISTEAYHKVINASGLIVAPGFIDTYSHSDIKLLKKNYVESQIRQGVTTEILGQSGISAAPLPEKYIIPWKKNISILKGECDSIKWNWENMKGYLKKIEKVGPICNCAFLVPHGNIRMEAIGLSKKSTSSKELENMKKILERELNSGAIGMSTGLSYPPCSYSTRKELIELCNVLAKHDKIFVVHLRNEADRVINSIEEIVNVVKKTGVKVHFSNLRVCGKYNKSKVSYIIDMLNILNSEGYNITYDQSPYELESNELSIVLPHWVHEGGEKKLIERLKREDVRKRIIRDIENGIQNWENFLDFIGFENIYISNLKLEKNQNFIGKNLLEIASILEKDKYNSIFDLLIEEKNQVKIHYYLSSEEDTVKFLKRPEQNICTNSLFNDYNHPRKTGSFPKVIRRYVRELEELSLEEAIYKMTGKAAKNFKIKDRGFIKQGKKADIVIFDPNLIKDKSDFKNPEKFPEGIEYIFVNGRIVFIEGDIIKVSSGEIIK